MLVSCRDVMGSCGGRVLGRVLFLDTENDAFPDDEEDAVVLSVVDSLLDELLIDTVMALSH